MRYEDIEFYFKSNNETESELIQKCKDNAENYLSSPLEEEKGKDSPWLDKERPQVALNRIRTMLQTLNRTISQYDAKSDRLKQIHQLVWSPDKRTVSTPLLLAIEASIHSHIEWSKLNFHDIYSAVATEKFLGNKQDPLWIIKTVTLLIAWQNIYRTCCKHTLDNKPEPLPEVGVFQNRELKFDRESIATTIGNLLCYAASKSKCDCDASVIADAMFLSAVAYEGRHGKPVNIDAFNQFNDLVQNAIAINKQNTDNQNAPNLVHFEFGRYVFPDLEDSKKQKAKEILETIVDKVFLNEDKTISQTIWISFDRFWGINHAQSLQDFLSQVPPGDIPNLFEDVLEKSEKQEDSERLDISHSFIKLLGWSNFHKLNLKEEDAFKVAFNCSSDKPYCQNIKSLDIWGRISSAISIFLDKRYPSSKDETKTIPWAYILRILNTLAHIYPKEFFQLEVIRPNSPEELGDRNIIMLPQKTPEVEDFQELSDKIKSLRDELKQKKEQLDEIRERLDSQDSEPESKHYLKKQAELIEQEIKSIKQTFQDQVQKYLQNWHDKDKLKKSIDVWHNPKLLIGRCFASLLINQRIAFGNEKQDIECDQQFNAQAENWLVIAGCIADLNLHKNLEAYLQVYLTPKIQQELHKTSEKHTEDATILGVDIGGTSIKMALFEYNPDKDNLGKCLYSPEKTLDTQKEDKAQYEDPKEFVDRLDNFLQKNLDKSQSQLAQNWKDHHLMAIGVTWPGAVAGDLGYEYVASYSGVIKNFEPFNPEKFFVDPQDPKRTVEARKLHQYLKIREAFEEKFNVPAILMNDGVSHVTYYSGQFNREVLSIGETKETVVGLVAGTGTAGAVISGITGNVLKVLAETAKQINDLGCPFPIDVDGYPAGLNREIFNQNTIPNIAKTLAQEWGVSVPFKDGKIPGLLISWILEKNIEKGKQNQDALNKIEGWWNKDDQLKKIPIDEAEKQFIEAFSSADKNPFDFAKEVAKRVGQGLADLIAQVVYLYGSKNVFTGGGPMSGVTGKYIRQFARHELREQYGFDVTGHEKYAIDSSYKPSSITHHLTQLIRFPEPSTDLEPPGPSGCRGAAETVLQRFSQKTVTLNYSPCFLAFSMINLGNPTGGKLCFCKKDEPSLKETAGYVRSRLRALESSGIQHKIDGKIHDVYDSLPWRDYSKDALTTIDDLFKIVKQNDKNHYHLVISARNTINEYQYQVRIDEKWYRRIGDGEVDLDWPVICIDKNDVCLLPFSEAKGTEKDLVTGIPLVISGKTVSRAFLVANCSDVAHSFDVDPEGRRGSPAKAWQELSECWQRAKNEGVSEYIFEQRMERIAEYYHLQPSRHILHSIMAQSHNGDILVFAITGSLKAIAKKLVEQYQVENAVLLDNGGSVGWHYLGKGKDDPNLIIARPNYRPRGLVFIDLWVNNFIQPQEHFILS